VVADGVVVQPDPQDTDKSNNNDGPSQQPPPQQPPVGGPVNISDLEARFRALEGN
jgi:hypothetical protein